VIAQGASDERFREAEKFYYAGKYQEAVEKFQTAYAPNWEKNSFTEYMLILCFEKLRDYKSALTLIDFALNSPDRHLGPHTRSELEQKKAQISKLLS
jgi:tetratricopeptide (TPR) repeat protein